MATSAVVAIFLVFSLYSCYYFNRMPTTRSSNIVDLRYMHSAEYSFTAYVKPSLLYDNRTEVHEEDPIYTTLVEKIEINLQYNLTQTPTPLKLTDIDIRLWDSAVLSGGDWAKTYLLNFLKTNSSSFTTTYTINMDEVKEIVETIGEETENRVYSYTYEITPQILFRATAGETPIREEFNPTLLIKFEGGKIEVDELSKTKIETITHIENKIVTLRLLGFTLEMEDMPGISLMVAAAFSIALYYSGKNTLKEFSSRNFMERMSGDMRDKIVEVTELPIHTGRTIVNMSSLEDLAKVAEETFKTILHHEGVFYVLDGDVRYEFRIPHRSTGTKQHYNHSYENGSDVNIFSPPSEKITR